MSIDWNTYAASSERWRREGSIYVSTINAYVAKGMTEGWETVGDQPQDTRQDMAAHVMDIVRAANRASDLEQLRHFFPPAYEPLHELIEERAQNISSVLLLEDGRIIVRVGQPWEEGKVWVIIRSTATVVPDVPAFGRSPDRRFYARAHTEGVAIHEGWDGQVVCSRLPWPTKTERLPTRPETGPVKEAPPISSITPFPDGKRALLVSSVGIFVLTTEGAIRIHPTQEAVDEFLTWHREKYPDEQPNLELAMEHAALAPDGSLIVVGDQDGGHRFLDAHFREVITVDPASSYPHYAIFSVDGQQVACNSCHFYNGETLGVPVALLFKVAPEASALEDHLVHLDDQCRVYAAVARNDEYIFGDAYGYLRARSMTGTDRGQHFLGSTISSMDISHDDTSVVVGTYGGIVHLLTLDTGVTDPFAIGTTTHREQRRWIFWKGESQPLIW